MTCPRVSLDLGVMQDPRSPQPRPALTDSPAARVVVFIDERESVFQHCFGQRRQGCRWHRAEFRRAVAALAALRTGAHG